MNKYKILCEKITPMKSEKIVIQEKSTSKTSKKSPCKKTVAMHKEKLTPLKSELASISGKKTGK